MNSDDTTQEPGERELFENARDVGDTSAGQAANTGWTWRRVVLVMLTGIGAGFLAGLFGVGGGLIIVPALMTVLSMPQKQAAATSLASIVITAAAGCLSYTWQGQISLLAAVFLVPGALLGTQLGLWLLRRLPERALPWIFVGFVLLVIVSHQRQVPVRDVTVEWTVGSAVAVLGVGILAGVFAGLVGVGGGGVMVPGMELVVGLGDLVARGTSLLSMIPAALSGSWTNRRHRLVDIRTAALLGAAAAIATPVGALVAGLVSPRTGAIMFDLFLCYVALTMIRRGREHG